MRRPAGYTSSVTGSLHYMRLRTGLPSPHAYMDLLIPQSYVFIQTNAASIRPLESTRQIASTTPPTLA